MFPQHYYHDTKSTKSKCTYQPTGDFVFRKFAQSKPYWRQGGGAAIKKNKTLILADWTVENWSAEKRQAVINKLFEALEAGFSIYAWQSGQIEEINKDNLLRLLKDPQVLERMASPTATKDIVDAAVQELPNSAGDDILVLDDFQINGLLHPEVFARPNAQPRELDVAKILKYKHNKDHLIAVLGTMKPPIEGFTDTEVSEESFQLLEKLQKQFPEIPIKTQFKTVKLTDKIIQSLLTDGKATVARRTLLPEQLQLLEEVVLDGVSGASLEKIAPYLSSVKKLTLLNIERDFNFSDKTNIVLPSLKRIKLLDSTVRTTDLVPIIKNSPQLKRLDVLSSELKDNGNFTAIASTCLDTIKLANGGFSKKNLQEIVRQHKIKRIIFSKTEMIADTLTGIKGSDLSSIKIMEIDSCICDAKYLDQMLGALPQLEHLRIRGGSIKHFTNTFSLPSLKILEMDLQRFNEIASAFNDLEIEQLILVDENTSDIPQLGKIKLSRMHYFRISNNKLDHQFLNGVLKDASRLKHLDLQECTNLNDIADKISLTNIDTLNLSKTDITAESLERILEKMPKLRRLDLSGCAQLNLTPKLRNLLNRKQVFYPEHVKAERKKPDYLNDDSMQHTLDDLQNKPKNKEASPDDRKKTGGLPDSGGGASSGKVFRDDAGDNSDEEYMDADTRLNEGAEYSPTVIFFPINKNKPIPAVSQYRERLFNDIEISETPCDITKAFKKKRVGDLQLQPCSPVVCGKDVFQEASALEHSPEHECYYGKTPLTLTHEWQPLPSLNAQELLTHYHIDPPDIEVELQYSARDNQYYIRSKNGVESKCSIDLLLKVPIQSKVLPRGIQDLVDEFAGSSSKRGFGIGALVIDKENPTGMDYLEAMLSQKKGACRHSAIAFKHLMKKQFPSIPVRIMDNRVHEQVEIFVDREWVKCNLGGHPGKVKLDMKNDPRQKIAQPLLQADSLGDAPIDDDDQIVQYLQTWKKSKQPELTLEAYCQKLTEPKQQKKYLIENSNSVSVQALALALKAYCKQHNKPFIDIKNPDDITCSAPFITTEGNRGIINEGPGGRFHSFLTKAYDKENPPIIVINAEQFGTDDLVQHNSIFDDNPKADGTSLPEGAIVFLLTNTSKPNFTPGADLTSRMDHIETCPVPEKTLNLAFPPIAPKPAEGGDAIELFLSESWETLLLGQWVIQGNHLVFEEGQLQRALKEGSLITISNGLWENESFQYFWKEAKQNGFIEYEDQRIELPKDFDIVIKSGYDWKRLAAAVSFKAGAKPGETCLNPGLLNIFFSEYEHLESTNGMKRLLGVIQKAAGGELVVNITRELDEHQWAQLLTESLKHKVHLVCHCIPGITVPEPLQHLFRAEEGEKTPAAWDKTCARCMVIKSTDRDTTVNQLTQQLPESIFIDVSELEPFDLLGHVQGSFDVKAQQLLFTRAEKVLGKALKENKNIILTGQCSDTLLDALVPLLLQRAQDPKAQGTVALVVDNECAYKFPHATKHEVSVDEKVAILKKNDAPELIQRLTKEQLEKESLSRLKARLRYFKRHPEAEGSFKAWDGMERLSTHINLAPYDLEKSEEKTQAVIKQRLEEMRSRLSDSPMLYLSGLTGVGKTTFIEKYLGTDPNITPYLGEELIEAWAQDKSKKLKLLFIDEANIGQRQWSEFAGLFQDPPSITTRDGKHYYLDKDHVVIFAGNPLSYGSERQLAPLFKQHGNAMVFEPMTGEFIYEMILKPLFEDTDLRDKAKEISLIVLELYRHLVNLSTNEVLISSRELQLIVLLTLSAYQRGVHTDPARIAAHYVYQIGSTMVPHEHKNDFDAAFKPKEPLYPKLTSPFKLKRSNYLITPSRQDLYQLTQDLLHLRNYKQGKGRNEVQKFGGIGGLIIEGEPGVGKSELVKAVMMEHGFEEATPSHEPAHEDQFIQIPISMRNEQKKKLLLKGLAKAAALILDEINSAPILERWLNDLLMNKHPITKKYPEKPGAILFGTQNPPTMGGRQKPSNAVKRRILHYVAQPYSPEEMVAILVNEGLNRISAERMVRVYIHLIHYARQNYLSPVPTFRDVLRLARIASNLNNIHALNAFYGSIDKPSLREALIRTDNRFDSTTLLALAKHLTSETIRIFDLHIRLFEHLVLQSMTDKKVRFMLNFLCIIMPKAGAIDDKNIAHFMRLCELDIEKIPNFEKLNEVFGQNPAMVDSFFSALDHNDFNTLAQFVVEYSELSPLISLLLTSPIRSACLARPKEYLGLAGDYLIKYPGTNESTQFALLEIYDFLNKHHLGVNDSWKLFLLQCDQQQLTKLHESIQTAGIASAEQLFHSMFSKSLLDELSYEKRNVYIKLMVEEPLLRKLNEPALCSAGLVSNFIDRSISIKIDPLEIMRSIEQRQDYPGLVDSMLSNDLAYAQANEPIDLAEVMKANEAKKQANIVVENVLKDASLGHILAISQVIGYVFAGRYTPLEQSIKWGLDALNTLQTQVIPRLAVSSKAEDKAIFEQLQNEMPRAIEAAGLKGVAIPLKGSDAYQERVSDLALDLMGLALELEFTPVNFALQESAEELFKKNATVDFAQPLMELPKALVEQQDKAIAELQTQKQAPTHGAAASTDGVKVFKQLDKSASESAKGDEPEHGINFNDKVVAVPQSDAQQHCISLKEKLRNIKERDKEADTSSSSPPIA